MEMMRASTRVFGLGFALVLAAASCSTDTGRAAPSFSPSHATPTTLARIDPSGCPVPDEAFCGTAVEVATALSGRESDSLLSLSRSTRIDCTEVARQYFPACEDEDVLEGYGISGADLLVEVMEREAYKSRLDAVLAGVDVSYFDELGDGSARLLGVGSCGPDTPGRRTYHLTWTAAVREGDDSAERFLGSFELTLEDHDWRIALWYLDTLERWEAENTDPLRNSFCEAGRHPWRS
jgi:hypothetical protein